MESSPNTVWVWGHSRCLPDVRRRVFIWDEFSEKELHISLPQIIHEDPNKWKTEYAQWLRDVGDSYVRTEYARKFEREHSGLTYWCSGVFRPQSRVCLKAGRETGE